MRTGNRRADGIKLTLLPVECDVAGYFLPDQWRIGSKCCISRYRNRRFVDINADEFGSCLRLRARFRNDQRSPYELLIRTSKPTVISSKTYRQPS